MYNPITGQLKSYGTNKCLHNHGSRYTMETCYDSELNQRFSYNGMRLKSWPLKDEDNYCVDIFNYNHTSDCVDSTSTNLIFIPI